MAKTLGMQENNRDLINFDDPTIKLIKETVAVGATDQELQLFLYQAKKSGLDPLARQIYFMKRRSKDGDKITIQTSIDGFRLIAERSGNYAGQDEVKFVEKENQAFPVSCTVTVYKSDRFGNRNGFSATAYWNEYVPQSPQDFMWKKMPHTMLAKVAESLALRKAFPQDLSGIYTDEEITEVEHEIKKSNPVLDAYRKKIFALGNNLGLTSEETKERSKNIFKVEHFSDLTEVQLGQIVKKLEKTIYDKKNEEKSSGNE